MSERVSRPAQPIRLDNYARSYTPTDDQDPTLPDHLTEVRNPHQTAVCDDCGNWIYVSTNRVEYGHRRDCTYRPDECDANPINRRSA